MIDSGLFVGTLRHRRFAPVSHAFTYPLFMALLDVDRVPELMRVSRVTSHNRWNWASFADRFDASDGLQVVLAEVHNTFGGSHHYWLRRDPASRTFRAGAAKSLYVSPFMPVDMDYNFAFTPPTGHLVAHMETVNAGSVCFDATLSLERRPWSAVEIRRALVRYPAMTANVVAGIHRQALKLWWKGVPLVRRVTRDGVGERAAWDTGTVDRTDPLMER